MHVSMPSSHATASAGSPPASGDSGGTPIARLQAKLKALVTELEQLSSEDLPAEEKQRKAELLQAGIQRVQQQIAALQQQALDKQQQAREAAAAAREGAAGSGPQEDDASSSARSPKPSMAPGGFLDVHA